MVDLDALLHEHSKKMQRITNALYTEYSVKKNDQTIISQGMIPPGWELAQPKIIPEIPVLYLTTQGKIVCLAFSVVSERL